MDFHRASDRLQRLAEGNKPAFSKSLFTSIKDLIDTSAALIQELRTGMSGDVAVNEVVDGLNAAGNSFSKQLQLTETVIEEEYRRLKQG